MSKVNLRLPVCNPDNTTKFTTVQVPKNKILWFLTIYESIYYGVQRGSMDGIVVTDEFMTLLKKVKLDSVLKTRIEINQSVGHFFRAVLIENNINLGKLLLQLGANADVIVNNYTVLYLAIARNDLTLANMCIRYTPTTINTQMPEGKTVLDKAIVILSYNWIKWCIDAGATVEERHVVTSLKWSCDNGIRELLIESCKATWSNEVIHAMLFSVRYEFNRIDAIQMMKLFLNNITKEGLNEAYIHLAENADVSESKNRYDTVYDITKLLLQNGAYQYCSKDGKTFMDNIVGNVDSDQELEFDAEEEMYWLNKLNTSHLTEIENRINRLTKLVTIFPVYQQFQSITIVFHGFLPTYVMLWIGDWLVRDELLEYQRVEIIEKMKRSIEKINLLKN